MSRWYDKSGKLYTEPVKMKNGNMREANLADARKLGLIPSVTSIIDVLAKPGLDKWKQGLLMDAVYEHFDSMPTTLEDCKAFAYEQYRLQMDKSTGFGSLFHNAIENHLSGMPVLLNEELEKYFRPFVKFMEDNNIKGESEKSFAADHDGLWFAGTKDLEDDVYVTDFKTQDTKGTGKFSTYPESLWQGAAYCLNNKKKFRNIYISSTEVGVFKIKEYKQEELEKAKVIFRRLLGLFYAIKGL